MKLLVDFDVDLQLGEGVSRWGGESGEDLCFSSATWWRSLLTASGFGPIMFEVRLAIYESLALDRLVTSPLITQKV